MKLALGPEIISSYKRLAYEVWYALAEFVDNSTQAYFNNKAILDKRLKEEGEKLTVTITTGLDVKGDFVRIEDNSIGMSEEELENAVHIGKPPDFTAGRSRYGLGLKTGASWFGNVWTIESKKLGETKAYKITINVPKVAGGNMELPCKVTSAPATEHKTVIEIRDLNNRGLSPKTLEKTRKYLSSLYRRDISNGNLTLIVNGEKLKWNSQVDKRLMRTKDGKPAREDFSFKVGTKKVTGWAGVLERGSRKEAGFSIIQSDRVIKGYPQSYRPETLFGTQEGGTNDLVNQRLFGELVLDDFEVSHTKDQILFNDAEKDLLEAALFKKLEWLRALALSHRSRGTTRKPASNAIRVDAFTMLEAEIDSKPMKEFMKGIVLPSNALIKKSNESVKNAVVKDGNPDLEAKVGDIRVAVYLVKNMSPDEPHLIVEATKSKSSVVVIINGQHPHWAQLTNKESVLNFIRHCTYDGIAESHAYFKTDEIEPDTVKLIKDKLLRIPMELQSAS